MAQGETYEEFEEKFERAKARTTDDCYTPPEIYAAILAWVRARYDLPDDCTILRPFFKGGDYEHADYPPGAVVVDNPPFSIACKILRFFAARGIKYFIFGDAKTALGRLVSEPSHAVVFCNAPITYSNGAVVRTAYDTNLEPPGTVVCYTSLHTVIERAKIAIDARAQRPRRRTITYPKNILKFSHLDAIVDRGVELRLDSADYSATRTAGGVNLFGGGLIVGDSTAEKIKQAIALPRPGAPSDITIELTDKDRATIAALNAKSAAPWQ